MSDDANVCAPESTNPLDLTRFVIKRIVNFDEYTLIEILYLDPSTRMILLFHVPNHVVTKARIIDPHFRDNDPLSLLARFRPDSKGWMDGVTMTLSLIPEPTDLVPLDNRSQR